VQPLTVAEILDIDAYARVRDDYRARVIAHKRQRRVSVGPRVSLVFEDRETLRYQIQEMTRVERTTDPQKVQVEVDVYNELVPGPGELSATLFIEITESTRIRAELDRLIGLHEHVALEIGGERVPARFDPRQLEDDRISAVHYLRFALAPAQIERFADAALPVALRIDHPRYEARSALAPATRQSLAVDLSGDPAPIFRFGAAPPPPRPAPRVVAARGRVRALELSAGRVVVEGVPPAPPFPALPDDLAAELLALAREIAADWLRQGRPSELAIDAAGPHARIEIRAR